MAMTIAQAEALLGPKAAAQIRKKFNRQEHAGGTGAGRVSRGRVRTKREEGMNGLEADYEAQVLKPALQAGEIVWYRYESLKLRLADNTFLTIDFFVMTAAGELEAHETKGFMEEDANVKWKVARSMYPFRFKLIRRRRKADGGGFSIEVFE
jgi:hypothetical protein